MTTTLAVAYSQAGFTRWYDSRRLAEWHAHSGALSAIPAEPECGVRYYLSDDGGSGYALTATGDLQQVFSNVRGRGDAIVSDAVARGARTLDCFDGYLPTLYARHGFRETRREANWTVGGPDVVFMVHP